MKGKTMADQNCGQALVKLLEAYGVETVFGIPGVHTLELYRGLESSTIKHVLPRHEQGAGFMADGYARVSGRPGVCFLITGPGVTNAATPMGQAYSDSIPMLVISSVNARADMAKGRGCLHETQDQRAITAPLCAFSATAMTPDDIPDLLARAFSVFESARPRPVHIEIPIDVLAEKVTAEWPAASAAKRPTASPDQVEEAAGLLSGAERPVLIIGGGAIEAGEAMALVAEKTGAMMVTTIAGKGIVADSHPQSLGASCSLEPTQKLLAESDMVLAIGTELAETDSWTPRLAFGGKLIRVDIDPMMINNFYHADLGIVSDAASFAESLAAALCGNAKATKPEPRHEDVIALRRNFVEQRTPLQKKHIKILKVLRDVMPENGVVVSDMTQIAYTGNFAYPCEKPRTWFHPCGYGTLGFALPTAVGAKLGAPDRPCVALVGDGGFLYTVQDLATAVELDQPLIVLLWNNDGLGQIRDSMAARGISEIAVNPRNPDFLALATAMGCNGESVGSLKHLERSLQKALEHPGVSFIEVPHTMAGLAD